MPQKTHPASVMAAVAVPTGSGQRAAFEVDRSAVAQRRVQPFPVVELVQKLADADARFGQMRASPPSASALRRHRRQFELPREFPSRLDPVFPFP
jgi:hypothetical protein